MNKIFFKKELSLL